METDYYTREDLTDLKLELNEQRKKKRKFDKEYPDSLNNPHDKVISRTRKLIGLLEHNLNIKDYGHGTVLINSKFVVSLLNNKWREKGKNVWYHHKHDLTHFVCNYILKEDFVQPPTPEQELDYFDAKLQDLIRRRPAWLVKEIKDMMNERTDV